MLIHLISFKYKPDTGTAARHEHVAKLNTLGSLPGILELSVGSDVVRSARSYDTGLLVKFADRAALDVYAVHPQHVPIAQFGASICDHIVAVDFEC